MNVYIVINTRDNLRQYVDCKSTYEKAREALLDFLINDEDGYDPRQWPWLAEDNDFASVEEFQETILHCSDYDDELGMEILIETI